MKINFHSGWGAMRKQSLRCLGLLPAASHRMDGDWKSPARLWAWPTVQQVRQSGVALVATLIMLSLVTFMVVAFLGVARRERRAIESISSQGESRNAMEIGLARAQSEVLVRLLSTGDKWNYWLTVPTNYQNYGYAVNGTFSPTNVNHTNALAQGLNPWLTNLANLRLDPRAPVFSSFYNNTTPFDANANETYQGRYYLDFNRNRMFDYTDRLVAGDPHWIGVLEYPDVPHGPTNRFLSRYTYVAVPAGKTVDLNLIHNQAKLNAGNTEGYLRNNGVGAHEMNMAAVLADLNPAVWSYNYNSGAGTSLGIAFQDALSLQLFRNNGNANTFATFDTLFGAIPAANLFAPSPRFDIRGNGPVMTTLLLTSDAADTAAQRWQGGSNTAALAQRFLDINEVFQSGRAYSAVFTTNLVFAGSNSVTTAPADDHNRRTFYNLISSVGVNSWATTNQINLNWSNAPYVGSNIVLETSGGALGGFKDWDPNYFFYNAAELMIRASITPVVFLNTNWIGFGGGDTNVTLTNLYFGTNFVGTNYQATISITNIPIFSVAGNYYLPLVHRLLQFTANLYDATTTNSAAPAYPTVFRPLFAFNTNGWPSNDFIKIYGYTTNGTDSANMLAMPMVDLADPNSRWAMYTNGTGLTPTGDGVNDASLVAGIPVIIGARKGYPNFNEFGAQTIFSATRRLEFVKTNATNFSASAIVQTNQSLVITLSNIFAFEAWNSYAATFPRELQLEASVISQVTLTNELGPVYTNVITNTISTNIAANTWTGFSGNNYLASFKGFFFADFPVLSATPARGYAYGTNFPPLAGFTNGGFLPASPTPTGPSIFGRSNGFPEMKLGVHINNSLRYVMYEPVGGRVVDFVTLTNLILGADLASALLVTNGPADAGAAFWDPRPYITNRSVFAPTLGISNQIALCLNTNVNALTTNQWRQWSLNTPLLREIDRFRRFLGLPTALPVNFLPSPSTSIQTPFNPTRLVAVAKSWEVNDPFVHYNGRDLEDTFRGASADQATPLSLPPGPIPPPGTVYQTGMGFVNGRFQQFTYGGINRYYMPWGRSLDTFGTRIANLPNYLYVAPPAYDQRLKDAGVFNSDQWNFPQRKFANLGWIGRVHRGTPWQTFYLKSDSPNPTNWFFWARSADTHPTNDWRLVDVLSTALSSDTTRGLLSVNQTNSAAWAAALGGTVVLSNSGAGATNNIITPQTPQFAAIVGSSTNGIINAKQRIPMWSPVGNYSAGDVAGYWFGTAGIAYYRAISGGNQAQNPYTQTTAGNFANWTNVYYWNSTATYTVGDVVAHHGVSYYSTITGNINYPPHLNPGIWEPYFSRSFNRMGAVLSTPELSVQSPYLNGAIPWQPNTGYAAGNRVYWQGWYYQATRGVPANTPPNPLLNYSNLRTSASSYWWPLESPAISLSVSSSLQDNIIERIPQQTLGLLTLETSPRIVIYAYGQSLRPAERGVYVGGGTFQGMVTNYQITGEVASRAVVRIDGLPEPGMLPRPLPAGAPTLVSPRVVVEEFKLINADK